MRAVGMYRLKFRLQSRTESHVSRRRINKNFLCPRSQSGSYFSRTGSGPLKKKTVKPGGKVCGGNDGFKNILNRVKDESGFIALM